MTHTLPYHDGTLSRLRASVSELLGAADAAEAATMKAQWSTPKVRQLLRTCRSLGIMREAVVSADWNILGVHLNFVGKFSSSKSPPLAADVTPLANAVDAAESDPGSLEYFAAEATPEIEAMQIAYDRLCLIPSLKEALEIGTGLSLASVVGSHAPRSNLDRVDTSRLRTVLETMAHSKAIVDPEARSLVMACDVVLASRVALRDKDWSALGDALGIAPNDVRAHSESNIFRAIARSTAQQGKSPWPLVAADLIAARDEHWNHAVEVRLLQATSRGGPALRDHENLLDYSCIDTSELKAALSLCHAHAAACSHSERCANLKATAVCLMDLRQALLAADVDAQQAAVQRCVGSEPAVDATEVSWSTRWPVAARREMQMCVNTVNFAAIGHLFDGPESVLRRGRGDGELGALDANSIELERLALAVRNADELLKPTSGLESSRNKRIASLLISARGLLPLRAALKSPKTDWGAAKDAAAALHALSDDLHEICRPEVCLAMDRVGNHDASVRIINVLSRGAASGVPGNIDTSQISAGLTELKNAIENAKSLSRKGRPLFALIKCAESVQSIRSAFIARSGDRILYPALKVAVDNASQIESEVRGLIVQ